MIYMDGFMTFVGLSLAMVIASVAYCSIQAFELWLYNKYGQYYDDETEGEG